MQTNYTAASSNTRRPGIIRYSAPQSKKTKQCRLTKHGAVACPTNPLQHAINPIDLLLSIQKLHILVLSLSINIKKLKQLLFTEQHGAQWHGYLILQDYACSIGLFSMQQSGSTIYSVWPILLSGIEATQSCKLLSSSNNMYLLHTRNSINWSIDHTNA